MDSTDFTVLNLIFVCRIILASHGHCDGGGYHIIRLDSIKSDISLLEITENNFRMGKVNFVTRGGGLAGSLGHTPTATPTSRTPIHGPINQSVARPGTAEAPAKCNLREIHHHPPGLDNIPNGAESHVGVVYAPIEHLRDSQFVGELLVGTPGQKIKPLFDTGSANTWIISTECNLPTCKKVPQFDPFKSKTFRRNELKDMLTVYFGTGMIMGHFASETVEFCGTILNDQNIALIQYQGPSDRGANSSNIFEKLKFQGLFGLAFPEMSATGDTVFQNFVKKRNLTPEFAFYISPTNLKPSFLLIGGVDRRFYEGELKMAQVVRKHYWEVALTQLWVGDTMLCCENEQDSTILREESDQNNDAQSTIEKSYVIVDSGTSFNSLPHRDYERFIKLVPSIPAASFSADKIASYPTIKYVLGDIVLKLKPTDYMVLHDGFYRAGFIQIDIPSQFGRAYILGSNIFMKRYFTVFRHAHNGNPPMIGFAESKGSWV
ncbi:Eukaryotic aspartyl protease [Babesia microti strain RI]|uniref:Eukaryotic aspartyl protease n=1 Tax=Babesia microti (strain RI) TaxID=1133968 RepID=A0A1R4ABA2_BABMR|nr:Eukaryotic aspartyl protease [Babesia microti strain RI]SJK86292.1 Eukaryotic aspartyl protease [Babesia microti strain RI]|eukprot:XP_021338468.1 Eukaryotic aspartyl protease [Babesia microti strain RI]